MMMRIWTVARRELKALFDLPTGYVLLVAFLALNAFLFFRQAYLSQVASLRPMLDVLPWEFLFFVPAVTMRSLAEDIRGGQLEVVLSQPLSELELLLGKYVASVLFLWIALALTLLIPLGLSLGAAMPWSTVVAQYVGAGLLAAGFAGIGTWASSVSRSQITAFILAAVPMFILILAGLNPLLVGLPPGLAAAAARIGVLSHFDNIGRGVIDLRDAVYFVSLAGIFLALAYGALLGRKLAPRGGARRRLRLGVGLVAASLVVVNLLGGYIGGRLDLSPGRAYTLSPATRQVLGNLDDLVTIKLFASAELPTEVALMKRDVDDLLRDVRAAGHGRIRVIERDPSTDAAARQDAQSLGIQPVQFNVIGQSELQVKQGYLGLAIQHGSQTDAVPFVQQTDDLEYRLISSIRNLTRAHKPAIGFLAAAAGGPSAGTGYQDMQEQLAKSYDVRSLTPGDSIQHDTAFAAIVLAGAPDSLPAGQLARLERYLDHGGSILVLAGGMAIAPDMPMARPRALPWNSLLQRFGVSVRGDLAYDLLANEAIPVPSDFGRVMQMYPFFIRAESTRRSPINQDLGAAVLTWASTIDTSKAAPGTITPLLVTSDAAGTFTDAASIDPGSTFPRDKLGRRLLAVVAAPRDSARGRAVVIGSTDFATDRFVRVAPENLALALNATDWLAEDEGLIAIRSKDRRPVPLVFETATERELAKYGNLIGLPLLVALVGLVHLARRRRRTREPYQPLVPAGEAAT